MRKGFWKRLLSLCLVIVMILALAACGKGGDESGSGNDGAGNANSELAKQYVFSYDKVEIGDLGNGVGIHTMSQANGRVYLLLDMWIYEDAEIMPRDAVASSELQIPSYDIAVDDVVMESSSRNVFRVVSFLPDGSDLKTYDLDMSTAEDISYSWLNRTMFGGDKVYAINNSERVDESDPQNYIYETITELVCWGDDGAKLWSVDLKEVLGEGADQGYVQQLGMTEDGKILIICSYYDDMGQTRKIFTYDTNGNIIGEKKLDIPETNVGQIIINPDGTLLVTVYNENYDGTSAFTYDINTGTAGEKTELPDMLMMNGFFPGTVTDFVTTNNEGIYTYNLGDEDVTQIMSFINSDLDTIWLNNMIMIDAEHIVAAYNSIIDNEFKVVAMEKVDPEDIPDKKVLVLGANYLEYSTRKRVIDFNRTNTKYRITVRDYSTYQTMEDYQAGYTQLNNDIISGKMPDILIVDSQTKLDNYIAKGLIADVGKLIKSDPELSSLEYMENVFEAYSVDGTLYRVVPTFSVESMVGKKAIFGDRTGWNMEEFLQMADELEDGSSLLGRFTRDSFFYQIMQYCGTDFIDAATGKCSFNSPEFIRMLEYAKTLPEMVEQDEDYWMNYDSQFREDRTMVMTVSLYNVREMNYTINGYFGEDITFLGFPNADKNGSVINAGTSYVISSKSKDLEGAWEFVRYYLTEEYQTGDDISWGFPVLRSAFMSQAAEGTEKPYYLDENGNKVEYDDYFYMNNESIIIDPLTQEQVDQIVSFVEGVNRASYYDQDIMNIVNEEAAFFFAGQKTAADVANIINNRVQLYVNDNR